MAAPSGSNRLRMWWSSTRKASLTRFARWPGTSSTTRSCRRWNRECTMKPERPPQDPAMNQHTAPVASVLVVDDGIDNLRLLSDLLGQHGYEVRAVTTGRQALQAVEHDPPDLILLDITMPEMNGYEVCQRLKA